MARFFTRNIKNSIKRMSQYTYNKPSIQEVIEEPKTINVVKENKEMKKEENMTTFDKIQQANAILSSETPKTSVKRVKKDKGLIERTESAKIVLTEDNKELLID